MQTNNPAHFASTIKNRTSQNATNVFNRASKANPKENCFKEISNA